MIDTSEALWDFIVLISAIMLILTIVDAILIYGSTSQLRCHEKSLIFLYLYVGIDCLVCLIYAIERVTCGNSVFMDLDPQIEELPKPKVMVEYRMTWDIVKIFALHLLSASTFHVNAMNCECIHRVEPVLGCCRVRG